MKGGCTIGRPDWDAIRAEYIGGGISQRKLAQKHKIKEGAMLRKANAEGWAKLREQARNKAIIKAEQKIANTVSDNAVTAERIRAKLLKRIEREIDSLPESIGTEMFNNIENLNYEGKRLTRKTYGGKSYKLRDLTAAYRDLTAGMMDDEAASKSPVQIIWGRKDVDV